MPRFFGKSQQSEILQNDNFDPLSYLLQPPEKETREEFEARLREQEEAKKRSDAIDEEINRQRAEMKKASNHVRVMLLGQSESGKSTTLKNFQLMSSAKYFRHERASWRAVIQLNVVRSVRIMLDAITDANANGSPPSTAVGMPQRRRTESIMSIESDSATAVSEPRGKQSISHSTNHSKFTPSPELLKLRMRLLPLQQVEETLLRKLTPAGSAEFEATHLSPITNLPYKARSGGKQMNKFGELTVNSTMQWKVAFGKLIASARASIDSAADIDFDDPNDPAVVLNACAEDITRLWEDPLVRQLLIAQKTLLEHMGGFFLDSIQRVTALRYVPTDDDILRARLKTLGVSQHDFVLKTAGGNILSKNWRVFDVGGARSLRAAWAPFFDDLNAIIFLAPISGFNETLLEDVKVNKLEDSILLWKYIVAHPILAKTQIILFLNKVDLFKAKLNAGVKVGDYLVSYSGKNDFESTSTYIRKKFAHLLKLHSPTPRTFYSHLTSMTDSKSTEKILCNVRDMVLRTMLESSNLL